MKSHTTFVGLLLPLLFCFQPFEAFPQEAKSPVFDASSNNQQLKYISAGMNNSYELMSTARATVSYHQLTPKGIFGDNNAREDVYNELWAVNGNSTSVSINFPENGKDIHAMTQLLFSSGGIAKNLYGTTKKSKDGKSNVIEYKGVIQSSSSVLSSLGMWRAFEDADPRNILFSNGGPRLFSSIILDPRASAQVQGEDNYNGSHCVKIRITPQNTRGYDMYWIDEDHGFIIRKVNSFRENKGNLVKVIELNSADLLESNGSWIPSFSEFRMGPSLDTIGSIQIIRRLRYSEFRTGSSAEPDVMEFKWPVGTVINDIVNQKTLVSTAVKRNALSLYNKQKQTSGKPEIIGEPISQDELLTLNKQRRLENKKDLQDVVRVIVEPQEATQLESLMTATASRIPDDRGMQKKTK